MKLMAMLLAILCFRITALGAGPEAVIRINQVGFTAGESKRAVVMSSRTLQSAQFEVLDAGHVAVFHADVGAEIGGWNSDYSDLYLLDLSPVKAPGTYTIAIKGVATSPPFRIATASDLYGPLLRNSLLFFQAQRDGDDVSRNILNRQPSHLADRTAFVYKPPVFGSKGLRGGLEELGGPIDVSGGWFDAGDYLKFVETTSYVTGIMLVAARDHGSPEMIAEARHGLDWLLKMWDPQAKTLYIQVGIGDGNAQITGDHDVWRLPEADDRNDAPAGTAEYFIKHRPVFAAGAPGVPLSPNLAGRMAAAFALGCQVFKTTDSKYAARLLAAGELIFEQAKITDVKQLTSVYPHDFYPEDEWRDDMEWGGAELCRAHLGDSSKDRAQKYRQQSAHWARAYLNSGNDDVLNLYDVSSLAHFELCGAIDQAGAVGGLEVSRSDLIANLKTQLEAATRQSHKAPFGLGLKYESGDLVPHVLGLALEAYFYDELTGTTAYRELVQDQLDFVLGENAWGTSFIVGAGSVFPFHLQHQVANLAGSLDGRGPLLLGAVVDGPTHGRSKLEDVPDGARLTPWPDGKDPYSPFTGAGVSYVDDVSSWPTVEPANDYTVPTVLLFARLAK